MYDLIVRHGTIVDGTGAPPFVGDIAVHGGRIVAVGPKLDGDATEIIDARGLLVTPGFVDIHTHYDGQVTWDPLLEPSTLHGVTTLVMGNCGVGFAPVRPGSEQWLIELMEGVEDIPGTALAEGMTWGWETFPQYLDALERMPRAIDIGTQVPHGAVRAYVMGERGARNEPATAADIAAMKDIVREALEAGAFGFSTSRTLAHKAIDGEPVPGTFAAEDELFGIGEALRELGRGLYELAPAGAAGEDIITPKKEVDWMCRLSAALGRPVTFALAQVDAAPDLWRELMDETRRAVDDGAQVYPQIAGRPAGVLVGLQSNHAFKGRPSYDEIAHLPLEQRVVELRDPQRKARILAETVEFTNPFAQYMGTQLHRIYVLGNPPNYEPGPEMSVQAIADREGVELQSKLYDLLLEEDGKALLMFPFLNYSHGNGDATYEMLRHPMGAMGLSDGGAHCGSICDASMPTWMLTHWARDRVRGPKLALEHVVKKQTHDTARLYGMCDRGTVEVGMKGDLNLIDFTRLTLHPPVMAHDLPAGGRRFLQSASGYVATIVSGEIVRREGVDTGARPGRLVRAGH
jgi:N-acyl-D-aspartate/D-glutamate deacylase